MRWAGHVERIVEMRSTYTSLVGNPERKRPLRRPRRRWINNIRMDLREIDLEGMDWIHLAQDRNHWRTLVNTVVNLRIPYEAGSFLSS
jgi:hypothetical protein